MSTIKVTTTQNIELEYDLASLGERIVAYIIDFFILGAYLVFISLVLDLGGRVPALIYFLVMMPIVFYDLVSELLMNGQSVGKRVMKMKVISLNGGRPSFGQYMIRWLFRLIDNLPSFNLCALISIAMSERHQRVGDMIAGTTLIKTVPRTTFQHTIYTPTPEVNYTVSFPEVATLSDRDMQLIKEVIITVNRTHNGMLAYQAAEKLKQTLGVQTNLEPLYFLQVLLADYNHITSK